MKLWIILFSVFLALSVTAAEKPSWQQEWERTISAAKKEGQVAVTGAAGPEARQALVEPFQKKYGITVDFFGTEGRALSPRILAERGAGQYLWDVYVHGTTTGLNVMIPKGVFDPLEPFLILPDVRDSKTWQGGALEFVDSGRRLAVTTRSHRATLYINPNLAKAEEFKSHKDLLDGKWKGKFIIDDPRRAGPGQATFTFFMMHPELGSDYIRALARQEPIVLRDYVQEVDFIAQGRYPVLLGGFDVPAETRIKQGAPVAIIDPRQLREGSDLSSSNGSVAIYRQAPHPNAAKVFVNWLLSQEGQTEFARRLGYVSTRKDVSSDHVAAWRVPQPGAIKTYTEEAQRVKDSLLPLLTELFGR
jgi:ABC-type Fe3+ transport system substrate-binding protein